jgi:hypothetical protein
MDQARVDFVPIRVPEKPPMPHQRLIQKEQQGRVMLPSEPREMLPVKAPIQHLQDNLKWWRQHASPTVFQLIQNGVQPQFPLPPLLSRCPQKKTLLDIQRASSILEEYQKVGAVKKVSADGTKHLIPWFIISKTEGNKEKNRLISDCRELNYYFQTTPFRLDHIQSIFPYLKKKWWGCKIDLKDAYFHLQVAETLKPYLRFQVGKDLWEFQASCFGLSILPQLFMSLMKPLEKIWRKKGYNIFVYLDDILLIAPSPEKLKRQLQMVLDTLNQAGFIINKEKSILEPQQKILHLGFILDFQQGVLCPQPEKLKSLRRDLGKVLCRPSMSCRKMAAILGQVRACLPAVTCLRAFTDTLVQFVNQHTAQGWDTILMIPQDIKRQIVELKEILLTWKGRPFGEKHTQHLHSDSSDLGWAGLDLATGKFVQEFWRQEADLHINVKELKAALATVQSLAKPNTSVLLSVDNQVIFYYLKKSGGKLAKFNTLLRPFLRWCLQNRIKLSIQWVPSEKMQADSISRWTMDRGDYTLDRNLFLVLHQKTKLWIQPKVDCFASPGNAQLPLFISRWPHHQAMLVDALQCPLHSLTTVYANPPWTLIEAWLFRLKNNPHLTCLFLCPYWVSSRWWPLLTQLHVPKSPVFLIPPYPGMFLHCQGFPMPPPRWPLICIILSGKYWKPGKCQLRPYKITWPV